MAQDLRAAGMKRINISLDSLRRRTLQAHHPHRRAGARCWRGIDAGAGAGFERLKLNTVIMRNRNDDEILDLVDFVRGPRHGHLLHRGDAARRDRRSRPRRRPTCPATRCARDHRARATSCCPPPRPPAARRATGGWRHRLQGRLHLAALPQLLRELQPGAGHRAGPAAAVPGPGALGGSARACCARTPATTRALRQAIVDSMAIKPKGHDFDLNRKVVIFRHMSVTGG